MTKLFKTREEANEASKELFGWKTRVRQITHYGINNETLYYIECNGRKTLNTDGFVK